MTAAVPYKRGLSIMERLDRLSIPIPHCGCWMWLGCLDSGGYGTIRISGKMIKASRASWMVHRGQIPSGQKVLHQCDTPPCINPDHLFLGTQIDNMQDMVAKGRQHSIKGESNPNAKLNVADVAAIRAMAGTHTEAARQFGVSISMICAIRNGKNWK